LGHSGESLGRQAGLRLIFRPALVSVLAEHVFLE
jgi:hypothetical protein